MNFLDLHPQIYLIFMDYASRLNKLELSKFYESYKELEKYKYLVLDKADSMKYVYDIHFRNEIQSQIEFPKKQLSLNCFDTNIKNEDLIHLNVHTLNLSYCKNITDVSLLKNVTNLNLTCCKGITDVSALGGVHTLNLSECDGVTDVSALGSVHTLNLSYCYNVTDVSNLFNCKKLILSFTKVKDISMLKNVENLVLLGYEK